LVDKQEVIGWTALMCAAMDGREAIVRLLLQRGASKELQDAYGETALQHAQRRGHTACVRLLTRGISIDIGVASAAPRA